ncbi:uncharacterized protein AB675_192 [Cyphellophora attinorum]|uniref:Guanine nucleotide-exchange factor SEC12 n=1 Tax=Cyphellophora attinorum TaxID=1664694 RepID=A0A0N0NKE0_9EURO|nr:uncharacterized protein AB675_192 [Phialophora attinorum]KPI37729.1 hypothetical protein AB675_192 [Phialophora attinorum]
MTPNVSQLRKKLGYPLYGADFDPLNPDFLLVGGGGGSSSTGVPNKISLIDTSRRDELHEVAEVELAKDEDSVTTLAVASSTEHALTAIAGINSSDAEQAAGKNEHLRSFRISLPARKRKVDGTNVEKIESPNRGTQALGKNALFKSANGPKNETYQRVLATSRIKSRSEARIAAIATGLAPENEVVVFQPVSNAVTSTVDEISRISLGKKEAADVDVVPIEGNGHCLAYCTDDAVFLQQLPRTKGSRIEAPVKVYETVESTSSVAPSRRPKFRALRFISPRYILLLQNKPARTGTSLIILKLSSDMSSGRITLKKALGKSTKAAVGLDVCPLSSNPAGDFQTIIAVATQESSIELLTIDYNNTAGMGRFNNVGFLRDVHSGPLTRIVFSNFIKPSTPANKTPPQHVRLASVGVDQTVVVQNMPLRPWPVESHTPRYILQEPPASTLQTSINIFIAFFVITLVAFLMQVFCEIRGALPPTLGAANWLSPRVSSLIAQPYPSLSPSAASSSISSIIDAISSAPGSIPTNILEPPSLSALQDQLSAAVASASYTVSSAAAGAAESAGLKTPKAIVVRDTGSDVSAELLHHDVEGRKRGDSAEMGGID